MADVKILSRTSRSTNPRYESSMSKMVDRIGGDLNEQEVKLITILTGCAIEPRIRKKIKNGKDLFFTLSKQGYCDESNFYSISEILKLIHRHDIVHMLQLQHTKVTLDPVEEYLKNISHIPHNINPVPSCSKCSHTLRISGRDKISETGTSTSTHDSISFSESISSPCKKLRRSQRISARSSNEPGRNSGLPGPGLQKYTCDVRLRVRAEYCNYDTVLQDNVSSMKPDPVDQQLECFGQASAILRTRDLGFIICDIKFSEVTYLDAFWRDYLNGSLLEALKGVFITESLKQAVGNETIKLLVNVSENDYEKGRSILINNLHQRL